MTQCQLNLTGYYTTVHTVRVHTVYQHMVRRGAPVPVSEVRPAGPYHGAPRTAGGAERLYPYRRYAPGGRTAVRSAHRRYR